MENTSSSRQNDPSEFFKDFIVSDFVCGRNMMAVIAAEKPKITVIEPSPALLEIEIEVPNYPDSPLLSTPSKYLSPSPPPKLPTPIIDSPEPVKTHIKPDTPEPEPVVDEIVRKTPSPKT